MTADMLIWIWLTLLLLPTIVRFARRGPFGIAWWLAADLLIGWHPVAWLTMLLLAARR